MGTNSSIEAASELLDRCSAFVEIFGQVHDKETLLQVTQEVIDEILPNIRCGMYLYNESMQRLEVVHSKGFNETEVRYAQETAMDRHPGLVFRTGQSIYIPDTSVDPKRLSFDSPRSFEVRSRIFCPIIANRKTIGAFGVASTIPNAFTEHDHALFKFVCKLVGATWERIREEDLRKHAEAAYHRVSLVAMHTSNSVIITDANGCIVWVNQGFEETTGYTLDEVSGKKPGSFLQGPLTRETEIEAIREALKKQTEVSCVLVNYNKDGKAYTIQLQIFPVFDVQGKLQSFVGLQRDISAEVQAIQLQEAHQLRLRQIIAHLPDLLFIIRPDGFVKEYYASSDEDLYTPKEEIIHASIYDLIPQDLAQALASRMQQVVSGATVDAYQYPLMYPEGTRYFEARFARLEEDAVMLVIRNITDEIEMEQQRERNHQFYKLLADFSSRLMVANRAQLLEMIEELLARSGAFFQADRSYVFRIDRQRNCMSNTFEWCKQGIAPQKDDLQDIPAELTHWTYSQILEGKTIAIPEVSQMPDGLPEKDMLQELSIASLVMLPLVSNRSIYGFVGFDFAHARKAWNDEEIQLFQVIAEQFSSIFSRMSLEAEREKFQRVFEHAAFGALMFRPDGSVHYANRYVADLCGLAPDAVLELEFNRIFPDAFEEGYALDALFEHDRVPLFEMRIQCTQQHPTYVLGTSVRFTDPESETPILACTFSDITARKEQEQETRNALQMVSDQNNRLLNFSYIVSHNIRSHSSNISGFTHLLDEELRNENENRRELMDALLKSSHMLDTTLRHLNDLLNMQAKHHLQHETILLHEVVQNTLSVLASEIKSLNVKVHLSVDEQLSLRTDRVYLESMLLNLMSNAIKYRKANVIPELGVEAFRDEEGLHIVVRDNGLGIDLARHGKRLFGMFKTFHGNPEARGIGLFITRNQVESLGGKISVESTPGMGSVFRIMLP